MKYFLILLFAAVSQLTAQEPNTIPIPDTIPKPDTIPADTLIPEPKDTASYLRQRNEREQADTTQYPSVREIDKCALSKNQKALARVGAGTAFAGGNVMLWRYFKNAWWSGERSDGFYWNADWDQEFRDQDKFGHFLGGYHLARWGDEVLRGVCVSENKALFWSAAYATLFQLQIEIWDGMYKKYGFSYPDLLANTTGMALYVAQAKFPKLKAIKPTISYTRSPAMRSPPNIRGELRYSLDYTGQTYWLSFDIDELLPKPAKPYWPGILRVSAGHSITDWVDPNTGAILRAKRKILLTLDLDLNKLPGDNPIWKQVKKTLGYYHFPAPALQLTPNFKGIKWYR